MTARKTWSHGGVVVVGCLVFVLLVAAVAYGQDESTWMRVTVVQVQPEKLDDYIELQLEEVNPALQRAGVPWRSAWRTAEFGNTYERVFVTPVANLAEFDTGGPLARSIDPDRLARLADRLRRCTQNRQSYAVRYRPDLSVESDDVGGLFLARVTSIRVAPGRGAEWERFLERNLPQFRGADTVFGVYQRVFGPGPTVWQIVQNHASFADLNQPGIVGQTFGDRAAEIASQLSGVLLSIERTVLRYDAELSFSAPPQPEERGAR